MGGGFKGVEDLLDVLRSHDASEGGLGGVAKLGVRGVELLEKLVGLVGSNLMGCGDRQKSQAEEECWGLSIHRW